MLAWGRNNYGQLGDGTTSNRLWPVQVQGLSGVVAVAAGSGHSLALSSDGTVWAWGSNLVARWEMAVRSTASCRCRCKG